MTQVDSPAEAFDLISSNDGAGAVAVHGAAGEIRGIHREAFDDRGAIDSPQTLDEPLFERGLAAYNQKNLDAFQASTHSEAVSFGPGSPFASESKAQGRQGLAATFAAVEQLNVAAIKPQYRVFGDTAIAWGHYAASVKVPGGPATGPIPG